MRLASPSCRKMSARLVKVSVLSIAAHLKKHRMEKAAQLLRETDLPVAEVARQVGYESQSKFTAAFKEQYGQLPKEYRRP